MSHGWERLTAASREALARRVQRRLRSGAGAAHRRRVLAARARRRRAAARRRLAARRAGATESSRLAPHGRPLHHPRHPRGEPSPSRYLENYVYRAAPDATVLVESGKRPPRAAVRDYGKGRVAAFGYRNAGLSWRMPMTARAVRRPTSIGSISTPCSAALAAVGGAARAGIGRFHQRRLGAEGRRRQAGAIRQGRAARSSTCPPAATSWSSTPARTSASKPSTLARPKRSRTSPPAKNWPAEGDTVEVTWKSAKPATVEVVDGLRPRDRARHRPGPRHACSCGRPLTHSGFVQVGREPHRPSASPPPTARWKDYEVIMPWYGPARIAALDRPPSTTSSAKPASPPWPAPSAISRSWPAPTCTRLRRLLVPRTPTTSSARPPTPKPATSNTSHATWSSRTPVSSPSCARSSHSASATLAPPQAAGLLPGRRIFAHQLHRRLRRGLGARRSGRLPPVAAQGVQHARSLNASWGTSFTQLGCRGAHDHRRGAEARQFRALGRPPRLHGAGVRARARARRARSFARSTPAPRPPSPARRCPPPTTAPTGTRSTRSWITSSPTPAATRTPCTTCSIPASC